MGKVTGEQGCARTRDSLAGEIGMSRRDMLRRSGTVFLVAAGAASGGAELAAQVYGTTPEGGSVPFRRPMGSLDYLDRNEYIHNMQIHAYLRVAGLYQGDRVTAPLWVKGAQRLLLCGGGRWVDVTDPRKPYVLNKERFEGNGQLAYATHLKKWIMLNSGMAPLTVPRPGYPRGQYHREYTQEVSNWQGFRGFKTYDVTDPSSHVLLQEFSTGQRGGGTHANFYDGGRYAYLDCGWDDQLRMESTERPYSNGLMIVDVWDPAQIREVSRWWVPGQRIGEEEEYRKWPFAGDQAAWTSNHGYCVPRRVEDGGDLGYGGWGHFGMFVHDFTEVTRPRVWGRVSHQLEATGGIPFHGIYPVVAESSHPRLRNLVLGVFESLEADCREPWHTSYVINVEDKRNPRIVGLFPRPIAPPGAPYTDFCFARGRFSAHNAQPWAAPGIAKPNVVAMSYFNAGVRVYDISDPTEPEEVAYYVPPRSGDIDEFESWRRGTTEGVFVEYDRNLIWVTTHEGLYCMSTPLLGEPVLEPRKVETWTVPHFNLGWDDQTPRGVYFGRGSSQL